ncbi:uncharacterized protein LOC124794687 isoform X3 [Schistocerca piceifrons]|uniref:uncharacterized protein LOC124794687 isoform X3 n=1 Tax=Schistocerca piceifrons TaxID=274613 RepID=UPI001F5F0383|nr:uncharacterized protein LOC124794687 isoform X3 [Schistocerca piceifrons]
MEATATTARKIHPVLQKMIQSGCQNQQKIAVAFQVYMELCEVEKLWNVRHHYNELHDFFYLTGKHSASSERDKIFIPLSITSDISPAWVENIQNEVCRNTSPKRYLLFHWSLRCLLENINYLFKKRIGSSNTLC